MCLYRNEWLISWTTDYELEVKGEVLYRFINPRQLIIWSAREKQTV